MGGESDWLKEAVSICTEGKAYHVLPAGNRNICTSITRPASARLKLPPASFPSLPNILCLPWLISLFSLSVALLIPSGGVEEWDFGMVVCLVLSLFGYHTAAEGGGSILCRRKDRVGVCMHVNNKLSVCRPG